MTFICEVRERETGRLTDSHTVTFADTLEEAQRGFGPALADYPAHKVTVTWRAEGEPAAQGRSSAS